MALGKPKETQTSMNSEKEFFTAHLTVHLTGPFNQDMSRLFKNWLADITLNNNILVKSFNVNTYFKDEQGMSEYLKNYGSEEETKK